MSSSPSNPLPGHGPAYNALTALEQAWLEEFVMNGGKPTDAAVVAGYGQNSPDPRSAKDAARRAGYTNTHSEKVLAALSEEAGLRLRSGALLGASVLVEIARDPGHKDRFKAAKELLGHNGFNIITEHKVTVEHTLSDAEKIQKVVEMAGRLGMDPQRLLGKYGYVVDAEFKLIAGPTADVVPSDDGLEDLLYGDAN